MYNSTSIVGSAVLWIDDPPQVKGKIKYQKVTTLSLLPGQVTGKSSTAASSACQDLLNIWDEEQAKSFLFMLFFCYHDAEVTIRTQECLYLLSFTIPVLLNFVDVPDHVIFLGLSSTTMSVAHFNYCFYSFITYINSFINPITLIRIAIFTCFFNIFLYYFKHI